MRNIVLLILLVAIGLPFGCSVANSARLEAAVKKELGAHPNLSGYIFEVAAADDGAVTITGEVYTQQEVALVGETAGKVEGVTRVINNCTVEEQGSSLIQDETVNVVPF